MGGWRCTVKANEADRKYAASLHGYTTKRRSELLLERKRTLERLTDLRRENP